MKINKTGAVLALFAILLPVPAFSGLAAGQGSRSPAESPTRAQSSQKEVLLFTYIPQGAALFSESDLQMAFLQVRFYPSQPGLILPPATGLPGPGRLSKPVSGSGALEKGAFAASLVTFVGLNIADYFVTRQVLHQLGQGGVNPVFRSFAKNDTAFAVFKLGYTLMSCISIYSLHDSDKPMAWALSLISNFLAGYALAYNLEQLHEHQ